MWKTRLFKTKKAFDKFTESNKHKYQMIDIFANNFVQDIEHLLIL